MIDYSVIWWCHSCSVGCYQVSVGQLCGERSRALLSRSRSNARWTERPTADGKQTRMLDMLSQSAPRSPVLRRCRPRRSRASRRDAASRAASVSRSRVPLMPSGWPSAIAPPFTLTLSRSRPSSFSTERYCAANASLISKRSMSSSARPVLASTLADRRRRPHPHQRRLDPDGRPRRRAAPSGVRPWRSHRLLGGEHQRGAAIHDAARVAGGDAAVLLEHRRQLAQSLERGLGAQVVVLREERAALALLDLDRHDLFGAAAPRPMPARRAAGCAARSGPAPRA